MITFEQYCKNRVMNEGKDYDFSSTQVNLPEPLASKIINWGKQEIPDEEISNDPNTGKSGREDEIHVTVLYGIHSANPEGVEKLLKGVKPFPVTLGKTSVFTNAEAFDVLKIGIESPMLHELNKRFRNGLEHTTKYDYSPHVTIAYMKKGKGWQYGKDDEFAGTKFTVNSIIFSSKNGKKTEIKLA